MATRETWPGLKVCTHTAEWPEVRFGGREIGVWILGYRTLVSHPYLTLQGEEERRSAAGSEKEEEPEEEEEEEEEEEYDEEEEEEDDDRPPKKPRHGGFILDEAGMSQGWQMLSRGWISTFSSIS